MHLLALCDLRDKGIYKDTLEDMDVKTSALGGSEVNRVIPCAHCHPCCCHHLESGLSPFKIFQSNNLNKPNISE